MSKPDVVSHTKELCFIDIETTGLNPHTDYIIEVAAKVLDLESEKVVQQFQTLVRFPGELPEFHKNGRFADADWGEAWSVHTVLSCLSVLLNNRAVAGQNPRFDLSFLEPAFHHCGMRWPADYHCVDTATLGHCLTRRGIVEGVSLRHLRGYGGKTGEQSHRAMSDVDDSIAVYLRFMREQIGLGK